VLFQDGFFDASCSNWERIYGGKAATVPKCGLLRFAIPANFTIWIRLKDTPAASAAAPDALVQASFFLLPEAPGRWRFAIAANWSEGAQKRYCALEHVDQIDTYRLGNSVTVGAGNAFESSPETFSLPPSDEPAVLQSYVESGIHHCRLVTRDRTEAVQVTMPGVLAAAGTISVETTNLPTTGPGLQLWVDSVRVFGAKP
jgi:hypothetical protein